MFILCSCIGVWMFELLDSLPGFYRSFLSYFFMLFDFPDQLQNRNFSQVIADDIPDADLEFLRNCDPHLMDAQTMKQVFGDKAATAQSVLFQHGTRITDQAEFLNPEQCIRVRKGERALATRYRKSQVHPTVWANALQSALRCSDLQLMNNDVAVIMTGGSSESVVGALAVGYRTVLYIGSNDAEVMMMTLPTEAEEASCKVDYAEYRGPPDKTRTP